MENVVKSSSRVLREKFPLKQGENDCYSLIDVRNNKVVLAIQKYEPELTENIETHFAFCEEVGAASTLLSRDDFEQFPTLDQAYELAIARILSFAKNVLS